MEKVKWMQIVREPEQSKETIGHLTCFEGETSFLKLATVELPWNNNQQGKSCIPVGEYVVKKRTSPKHGQHFIIENVPNRSFCLIHSANYIRELLGCIAPGLSHADIDKDGLLDVASSKNAMIKLWVNMPDIFKLIIK